MDLDILFFSSHHIDAIINQEGVVWHFTGSYKHPKTSRKGESWDLCVNSMHLLGDFYKILHPDEYWGNESWPCNQIAKFIRAVGDCLLLDELGFTRNWLCFLF